MSKKLTPNWESSTSSALGEGGNGAERRAERLVLASGIKSSDSLRSTSTDLGDGKDTPKGNGDGDRGRGSGGAGSSMYTEKSMLPSVSMPASPPPPLMEREEEKGCLDHNTCSLRSAGEGSFSFFFFLLLEEDAGCGSRSCAEKATTAAKLLLLLLLTPGAAGMGAVVGFGDAALGLGFASSTCTGAALVDDDIITGTAAGNGTGAEGLADAALWEEVADDIPVGVRAFGLGDGTAGSAREDNCLADSEGVSLTGEGGCRKSSSDNSTRPSSSRSLGTGGAASGFFCSCLDCCG